MPHGNNAARGSICADLLVWSIQTTVASISRRFFEVIVELFLLVFIGFGG